MADHTSSVEVDASPAALFDYLSDISNLPRYFDRITSAEPAEGEAVRVTARLPDGSTRQAEAWLTVDDAASRLEWGSEGPTEYHGWLTVEPVGDHQALVTVGISTNVEGVGQGLDDVVATIREQFESSGS